MGALRPRRFLSSGRMRCRRSMAVRPSTGFLSHGLGRDGHDPRARTHDRCRGAGKLGQLPLVRPLPFGVDCCRGTPVDHPMGLGGRHPCLLSLGDPGGSPRPSRHCDLVEASGGMADRGRLGSRAWSPGHGIPPWTCQGSRRGPPKSGQTWSRLRGERRPGRPRRDRRAQAADVRRHEVASGPFCFSWSSCWASLPCDVHPTDGSLCACWPLVLPPGCWRCCRTTPSSSVGRCTCCVGERPHPWRC